MNKRWEFKADGFIYCMATGERVCSPHSTLPDSIKRWKSHKQDLKANARLICAAPDLLAVCKELEESSGYWSQYDVPLCIVDRLKAAIAKAEGDST